MLNKLLQRITNEIELKATKFEIRGAVPVSIILQATDEEVATIMEIDLGEHYYIRAEGRGGSDVNYLHISYIEVR